MDRARTARAGIFRAIITAVASGTIISQGERTNREDRASLKEAMVSASAAGCSHPMRKNAISVSVMDGTVVTSM